MSALTVVLCIWAMVAISGILFTRGASPRVQRIIETPQRYPERFKR
jgi:hypothetical protein